MSMGSCDSQMQWVCTGCDDSSIICTESWCNTMLYQQRGFWMTHWIGATGLNVQKTGGPFSITPSPCINLILMHWHCVWYSALLGVQNGPLYREIGPIWDFQYPLNMNKDIWPFKNVWQDFQLGCKDRIWFYQRKQAAQSSCGTRIW